MVTVRRIFKGFAVLAMLGVLGIAALLCALWLEHRTEITLPTPTGSFAVGRAIYAWTDAVTSDTLAPVPGAKRELLVWIWYPSAGVLDRLELLNASDASGRFMGRLDMTRVGVFGHSFGGAQAAQFCHEDARCKAGIDVDGAPHGSVIQEGIHQPFMFLLSDHSHESDPASRQILANIQSIYDRLPRDGRLRIAIRGANHFLFSDDGALLKSHIVLRTLRTMGIIGIEGRRQLAVTAYCVRSFFNAYLKGTGVSRLEISSPLYPEIEVLQ